MRISFGLELFPQIVALRAEVWPDFIRVPEENMREIYQRYPMYQIALHDTELIGIANAIPIAWHEPLQNLHDEGVSWVMKHADYHKPNTLVGVSVTLAKKYRHQGLSKLLLATLKQLAIKNQLQHLLIPARPTLKKKYPLVPIETYVQWKIDPWLKVHEQLGAKFIKICNRSAIVNAPITQWQTWTNKLFPQDGFYVIEEGLVPIEINHTKNTGTYIEPNVWVAYEVTREQYDKAGTKN